MRTNTCSQRGAAFRQIGHFTSRPAQLEQQTRWPHPVNTTSRSPSMHTTHVNQSSGSNRDAFLRRRRMSTPFLRNVSRSEHPQRSTASGVIEARARMISAHGPLGMKSRPMQLTDTRVQSAAGPHLSVLRKYAAIHSTGATTGDATRSIAQHISSQSLGRVAPNPVQAGVVLRLVGSMSWRCCCFLDTWVIPPHFISFIIAIVDFPIAGNCSIPTLR